MALVEVVVVTLVELLVAVQAKAAESAGLEIVGGGGGGGITTDETYRRERESKCESVVELSLLLLKCRSTRLIHHSNDRNRQTFARSILLEVRFSVSAEFSPIRLLSSLWTHSQCLFVCVCVFNFL